MLSCVQLTDQFPLQTFLQGARIPEHTGGERCALDAALICMSRFQFSDKDTRCCQCVSHPSGGVMFFPAPRGWCCKMDVSFRGSSRLGVKSEKFAGSKYRASDGFACSESTGSAWGEPTDSVFCPLCWVPRHMDKAVAKSKVPKSPAIWKETVWTPFWLYHSALTWVPQAAVEVAHSSGIRPLQPML